MYEKVKTHLLPESSSSLYGNLDVKYEDDGDTGYKSMTLLSIHNTNVNLLSFQSGTTVHALVSPDNPGSKTKSNVVTAKWLQLSKENILVVLSHKGLVIFDSEGQLMMFSLANSEIDETSSCLSIACAKSKYICVGTSSGKVLVICQNKNVYTVKTTLHDHTLPVMCLSGLQSSKSNGVDMVSADDGGTIHCYKTGSDLLLSGKIPGTGVACTSVKLVQNGMVVAGYLTGHIRIFDSFSFTLLADIAGHVRAVSTLDATTVEDKSSYNFISASEDSFLRVWKISNQDTIQVSHEWCSSIRDTQLCGVRFCDESGQAFVAAGYDCKEIWQFSRIY
ncbi:WD repeat-containing protein 54-like [Ciona intestinalis]